MLNNRFHHLLSAANHPHVLLWSSLLSTALLAALSATTNAQPVDVQAVEKALLAEDWQKVADLLSTVDVNSPDPALRLIKGHACLALNQNDQSVCLFLSAQSAAARQQWQAWAEDFARVHARRSVAHYLRGDAEARLQHWDAALTSFSQALELDPQHVLTLNARGVVHGLHNEEEMAAADLCLAGQLQPSLADSYANIAAQLIQKRDGAVGVVNNYATAAEKSLGYALALFGLACGEYLMGDDDAARRHLKVAMACEGRQRQFLTDRVLVVLARLEERERGALAAAADVDARMAITRSVDRMVSAGDTGLGHRYMDQVWNQWKTGDVSTRQHITNELNRAMTERPSLARDFTNYTQAIKADQQLKTDLARSITGTSVSSATSAVGGGAVPGAIGGGKIESQTSVTFGPMQGMVDRFSRQMADATSLANSLASHPANPTQGFRTAIAGATWDRGDWPFEAVYGLLYTRSSADTSDAQEEQEP